MALILGFLGTPHRRELVVYRLDIDKVQGIQQLFAVGMSQRCIARTLGIDRKAVARYVAALSSKGATSDPAPSTEAPTGSDDSKGAKALTGSEATIGLPSVVESSALSAPISRSACDRFRDVIIAKIEQGLTAQRIHQDLIAEHGFDAKYHSVRRYVKSLQSDTTLPVRRMEVAAGYEMQVDYGQGVRCADHEGKMRKTYVFRLVLSHSRKGYTEAVRRLTTESFIRSL